MIQAHSLLLVDDDADDRYLMYHSFMELDYADLVRAFASGEELFRHLQALPHSALYPALIVLDYNMPQMNGAEVLMRLQRTEAFSHIPVAVYATGLQPMLQATLYSLGATYCFDKGRGEHDTAFQLAHRLKQLANDHVLQRELNLTGH